MPAKSEPIGRGQRFAILGFTFFVLTGLLHAIAKSIGYPSLVFLPTVFGVLKFVDWLLSDQPAPPAKAWIRYSIACFVVGPAVGILLSELWK